MTMENEMEKKVDRNESWIYIGLSRADLQGNIGLRDEG